jgi:hypothetical protein
MYVTRVKKPLQASIGQSEEQLTDVESRCANWWNIEH